jgi:hypothetical protein
MNIKNLKPNKNSRTKQGYFNISESTKYNGKTKKVIYRSSWEYKFCVWCEQNPNIQNWCSESVQIKYICPIENVTRNYYPDFWIKFTNGDTWIIEVKPEREYKIVPEPPKRKTKKAIQNYIDLKKTIRINIAKFRYASQYANNRGWKFFVADEKWFFNK